MVRRLICPKKDFRPEHMKTTKLKIIDPQVYQVYLRYGRTDCYNEEPIRVSMAHVTEFLALPKCISPYEDIKTLETKIVHNLAGMNYINLSAFDNMNGKILTDTMHYLRYRLLNLKQTDKWKPPSGGFQSRVY